MVYRGKPSAGCENCRKSKKRCGLEQPACERCVKLKKTCSGYRDTTTLQIQDESEAVKKKAEKSKVKPAFPQVQRQPSPLPLPQRRQQSAEAHQQNDYLAPATLIDPVISIPTPGSIHSDSTSSSDNTVDLERDILEDLWTPSAFDFAAYDPPQDEAAVWNYSLTPRLAPKPDDVATTYFYNSFTSNTHWEFMRGFAADGRVDSCLDLAIKACGMAALANIEHIPGSMAYARSMYVVALGLLNDALRDPQKCKTDSSLIAVSMLGRYETLTCDGRESIHSWKQHIKGSTQLLNVRGKAQFRTLVGRIMYREMRAQMLINAIWDDEYVPSFFREYQDAIEEYIEDGVYAPVEDMTRICFDFADLRANIRYGRTPNPQAAAQASELEQRFIQWEIDTMTYSDTWRYYEMEVDDAEHIWDGKIHSYSGLPAPTVWNTYRAMRIMLTRSQEWLCRRINFSEGEQEEQLQHFRRNRRQLTDDICATIPVSLGTSSPLFSSPCVLITAYHSIWPLFFAGTCALERVGTGALSIIRGESLPKGLVFNKAGAQAEWILGRLAYISKEIGLKWADGVAAVLRGDFAVPQQLLEEDDKRAIPRYTKLQRAVWLKQMAASQQAEPKPMPDTGVFRDDMLWEDMEQVTRRGKDRPMTIFREEGGPFQAQELGLLS